jgi:predicted extracellular nuclease
MVLFMEIANQPTLTANNNVLPRQKPSMVRKRHPEIDPEALILVAGDLNDFPWSTSIQTLAGSQLTNLYNTIDRSQWFTYIHEGNAQVMDQILVSESFIKNIDSFRPLHLNSILPADEQLSDHDPVMVILDFATNE